MMMRSVLLIVALLVFFSTKGQYHDPRIGDTVSAVHYEIHLKEINTQQQTIHAFAEIKLTPDFDGLGYIPLELKDLTVDSVFVDGQITPFSHEQEVLRIMTESSLNKEDTLQVRVHYHGKPFHESWGGFHFSGDYAFNLGVGFVSIPHNLGKTWFPCIDDFTDRATYTFHVTVPYGEKAICGGTLLDTLDNGDGTRTWVWDLPQKIPTYLASVATGPYVLFEDQYEGLTETIPIQIYTRPAEAGKVEGSFTRLKEILKWFEVRFGPYPYDRVGYTGTAIGAMEHATNIAYPHFAINGGSSYESLYTHELAHMWFGDRVTCSSAEDMWLNEGWATFCEIYYLDEIYGHQDYLTTKRKEHREILRKTHINDGGYYALNNIPQEFTYGEHAYNKGGTVANSLRGYLGDSVFFEAITAYLQHFADQSVSSGMMMDFLTEQTGRDMEGFFDSWVFTPGTPHFSMDSMKVTPAGGKFRADVWMKYQHKGAVHIGNHNVVELTFADSDFNLFTDTVHWSGSTGHSIKQLDFEPVAVFVDLYEKLNDATTDNYRYFAEAEEYTFPDTYFSLMIDQLDDSMLIQATHHWVPPDSLKDQVEGLSLSDYRHWEISGVFPEGMQAQGRFTYDRDGYLDQGLIQSDSDSVRMLYRKNAGDDWEEVEQSRFGTWNFGYIDIHQLKPGEYTLAVGDKYLGGQDFRQAQEVVQIFPNPTRGVLNFEFTEKDDYLVRLYDARGALLDEFEVNSRRRSWKWRNPEAFSGTVVVRIFKENQLVTSKKIIFTR